jgi:hypothetical protein
MASVMRALVVFFVAFNLFAGAVMATGTDAMLGLDTNVGGDDAVSAQTSDQDIPTGSATDGTLFGSYNVLTAQIAGFFETVFPGLSMLSRAGVPGFITTGILGPLFSLFSFVALVSFFRGYDL